MRVPIRHDLPREEVRRRLRERSHEINDHIPGGVAEVATSWSGEDRMNLAIGAMGQQLNGAILIEEQQVVVEVDLPLALSFLEPIISGAVEQQGEKLLAPPKDD